MPQHVGERAFSYTERGDEMSERDHYPPGVPCWVDTGQPDPHAAVDFYADVFGWEFVGPGEMPDGGLYFVARKEGRDVAGVGSLPPTVAGPAWSTYVAVNSVEEASEQARAAGGEVIAGPFDAPPAGRMAVLGDPAGAVLCVWEAGERKGSQRVNEPGAWSMSMLSTDDPDGAARFYGAVFGGERDIVEAGGATFTLWRLPGYLGGEPQQPVPRDVVGVMAPPTPDVPAAWSVDFWVSDTDAAASRATARGGSVIVEPHEMSGFRNAVLADPQGAVFSVSQLLTAG
jgi:predicted enzyme related to lactoylglutathione lyase